MGLDRPHRRDAAGDARRRLAGAAVEFSEGHRRDGDDEIEPPCEREIHSRPPAAHLARRAGAVGAVVAGVPARAGAHRRDELDGRAVERLRQRPQRRRPQQRQVPGARTGRETSAGSSPGRHRASSVFPAPAGPTSSRLCPPAAATSSARFAASWPHTSARSVTTRRAP